MKKQIIIWGDISLFLVAFFPIYIVIDGIPNCPMWLSVTMEIIKIISVLNLCTYLGFIIGHETNSKMCIPEIDIEALEKFSLNDNERTDEMEKLTIENITVDDLKKIKYIYEKNYYSDRTEIEKTQFKDEDTIALNEKGIVYYYHSFCYSHQKLFSFKMYGITWAFTKKELEK